MLSQLVDGLRHLRVPLGMGYPLVFSAWLAWAEYVPGHAEAIQQEEDLALRRTAQALVEVGPSGRLGLLTLLAFLVGYLFDRISLARRNQFVDWLAKQRRPEHNVCLLLAKALEVPELVAPTGEPYCALLQRRRLELDLRVAVFLPVVVPVAVAAVVGRARYGLLVAPLVAWFLADGATLLSCPRDWSHDISKGVRRKLQDDVRQRAKVLEEVVSTLVLKSGSNVKTVSGQVSHFTDPTYGSVDRLKTDELQQLSRSLLAVTTLVRNERWNGHEIREPLGILRDLMSDPATPATRDH